MTAPDAQPIRLQMSALDWVLLLVLGVLWGGSFFFARIAVAELPPLVLVFWRVAIAAVALQLFLALAGPSFRFAFRHVGALTLLAVLNNVIPFSLIFLGQTELGAGLASVLNATTPFWTLLLAAALTSDERLSLRKLAGVALGFAGTAVMLGSGMTTGAGSPLWAKLALVGASISYGCALMVARRLRALPPPVVAAGQLSASTVIMIPVLLVSGQSAALLAGSATVWAAVAALAIFSTALAYLIYFRIVAVAGATNASLVTFLVPVSAILLGVTFLGERLEASEVLGLGIILAGLGVIDGRMMPGGPARRR